MRIVSATLIALQTDDGLVEVQPDVPIGRVYDADLDTVRVADLWNFDKHRGHTKTIVQVRCSCGECNQWAWMAAELLKFEADG